MKIHSCLPYKTDRVSRFALSANQIRFADAAGKLGLPRFRWQCDSLLRCIKSVWLDLSHFYVRFDLDQCEQAICDAKCIYAVGAQRKGPLDGVLKNLASDRRAPGISSLQICLLWPKSI
jgi:hypothetical protein